jgi:hypothetical protein
MEYIVDGTKSPWCKLIGNQTFREFERFDDINYHCRFGYKYEITRLMTCDLLKDLVGRLNDIQKG